MKKILSLTLVLAMVMSMGITTAFAAGNWEGGTQVTYTATGAEEWTVTVPASLTPGNAGDVTAAGTWGSNRKLVVTADDSVKLTNSINSADYKDLAVTFADINLVGDNTKSVSETKQVSVAEMPADALFGTWSGTFYYDVEMVDVSAPVIPGATFTDGTTLTWEELKNEENGTKYGYGVPAISDTAFLDMAFMSCTSLTSITLPDSITMISNYAFRGCTSLTSLTFKGTTAQWNAITFGDEWNAGVPATEVICSDGTVPLT